MSWLWMIEVGINWHLIERYWRVQRKLVETLLRSPAFHRGVQKVHKQIHQFQHGKPPEHYGGTNLEDPTKTGNGSIKNFAKIFWEELKSGHKPEPPKKWATYKWIDRFSIGDCEPLTGVWLRIVHIGVIRIWSIYRCTSVSIEPSIWQEIVRSHNYQCAWRLDNCSLSSNARTDKIRSASIRSIRAWPSFHPKNRYWTWASTPVALVSLHGIGSLLRDSCSNTLRSTRLIYNNVQDFPVAHKFAIAILDIVGWNAGLSDNYICDRNGNREQVGI